MAATGLPAAKNLRVISSTFFIEAQIFGRAAAGITSGPHNHPDLRFKIVIDAEIMAALSL